MNATTKQEATRSNARSDRFLNAAAILTLGVAIYLAFPTAKRAWVGSTDEPARIRDLENVAVDSLIVADGVAGGERVVSLHGKPRVLYVFATTCAFCRLQQHHIATLLSSLGKEEVLTASGEPPMVTADYWTQVGAPIGPPLSLSQASLTALRGYSVPQLYFIRADGRIEKAFLGTVLKWTEARLRRELHGVMP
ncbi:MAG: hypothetical protein ABI587_07655 [Gemmatimonadales bacterium]